MKSLTLGKVFFILVGLIFICALLCSPIIWDSCFNRKKITSKNTILIGEDTVFVFFDDEISNKTFSDFKEIKKLSLKNLNKIKKIDKAAFIGFDNLKSIELPESIERIEDYAFAGCRSLTEITIPETTKYIGENCFLGCDNLITINFQIPESKVTNCEVDILNYDNKKISYLENCQLIFKEENKERTPTSEEK
ncbi:leucine-rich repeat domain-containing protein [Treponema sp.]|uniref:leucine-rich repeat domain-containing protein n=1 Tax=Treponema sp. TaxID=166 RepID=UPI00388ED6BE